MEPLSALSLAGNIIQFIEFSAKLVKKANEIKNSASGVTEEVEDATKISQSLHKLCQELQSHVQHIKGKGVLSKTGSLGVSWRTLTENGKLASMEQRLDRYRSEILSCILFMMSHEQSATHSLVETLVNRQDIHARSMQEELGKTRDYIVNAIKIELEGLESRAGSTRPQSLGDTDGSAPTTNPVVAEPAVHQLPSSSNEHFDVHLNMLSGMRTAIEKVAESATAIWIVKWLWFPELESRASSVTRAHKNTYAWLLHDEQSDESEECEGYHETWQQERARRNAQERARMKQEKRNAMLGWLESGKGVFYISGKAGSGKSTLMKCLAQDPVTHERLNDWAAKEGKDLILAEFFFWRPGVPLQREVEGLYRGILWEILKKSPGLTQKIFPNLWEDLSLIFEYRGEGRAPQLAELEVAFDILIRDSDVLSRHRVCLFIDDLDEYTGDYWRLSKLLSKWCGSDDIKICASGRPHNEFLRVFAASDEATWFTLHDLTRLDTLRFVRDELNRDERYMEAWQTNPQYEELIAAVVARADGVFLWVRLVLNDLLVAIGNSCSLIQLFRRLEAAPQDLSALFQQMLNRVDKAERTRLARTFLLLQMAKEFGLAKSVYAQAVLDDMEDGPGLEQQLLDGSLGPFLSPSEGTAKCFRMGRRLIGRGQGLLEIVENPDQEVPFRHNVQFVHRTLADYLQEPEVAAEIQSLAGEFNAKRSLALVILAMVKFWPRGKSNDPNSYAKETCYPIMGLISLSTSTYCLIAEFESLKRMLLKVERGEHEKDSVRFFRHCFNSKKAICSVVPEVSWTDFDYAVLCLVLAEDCSSQRNVLLATHRRE
ncbi:Vegetative incompatibility HET-E-1 [Fusarium albosuccineum]|uniref:Vegetative incompatibility HET-E-1 n=1 Tax=Fusarium albosuccineum TaxID=1237068 RepID=A0A8H4P9I6_9HYPO|nr:Vegetative incompatibility HET-E-1 [Fusarium albosuccineum]